ncbi:MAG TPA: nuclear transport factor 2 family protein [Candidatus Limnocylindria bacterium]|jgi:hypothetical protein
MIRPEDAYEAYVQAWNEPERAAALLEECWAADGVYADDEVPDGVVGRAALVALIVATHQALPGFRVWSTSAPRMLADRLAVTWAGEGGDPLERQAGSDVIEFTADGRIARVTDVLTAT